MAQGLELMWWDTGVAAKHLYSSLAPGYRL